jgi:hypothetical protein
MLSLFYLNQKITNMIKVLILFFLCVSFNFYSQEKEGITFTVKNGQNHHEIKSHVIAFEASKWDCYRMKTKPREIAFENGIVFELLPAIEIINTELKINTSCLTKEEDLVNYKAPIYRLSDTGKIIEIHEPFKPTKELKIK